MSGAGGTDGSGLDAVKGGMQLSGPLMTLGTESQTVNGRGDLTHCLWPDLPTSVDSRAR